MAESSPEKTFKIILMGDNCVGKTTFLKRHRTLEFQKKYEPTPGVEVWDLDFQTSHGMIRFNCWDISGHEKYEKLRNGYYLLGEAAIIIFDVTNRSSHENVSHWYHDLITTCGIDMPMVLCGNKIDCVSLRQIKPSEISPGHNSYYDISAKSNYNFEKPFLCLARKLCNEPTLQFC